MCTGECSSGNETTACCMAGTGSMRGLLKAWLLLLLFDGPAHGYQLMESLKREGSLQSVDAGLLYRTLRQFERDGAVRSVWATDVAGPARRVYQITELGRQQLEACVVHVHGARARLGCFLDASEARRESGRLQGRGGPGTETV